MATRTESVERAMSILTAFSLRRPRMTLAELAEETGLHKSTILRLTRSMALYGFVDRDSAGRFSIGASVWQLGLVFRQEFGSAEAVRPVLRRLVAATGQTATLFVRAGDDRVCLFRENGPRLEQYGVQEGVRLRLGAGASGLVLRHNTGETVDDPSLFNARGTVSLNATRNPNVAAIATPVFSGAGAFHGALTVSGPNDSFTDEVRAGFIPLLEECAGDLGRRIAPGTRDG